MTPSPTLVSGALINSPPPALASIPCASVLASVSCPVSVSVMAPPGPTETDAVPMVAMAFAVSPDRPPPVPASVKYEVPKSKDAIPVMNTWPAAPGLESRSKPTNEFSPPVAKWSTPMALMVTSA